MRRRHIYTQPILVNGEKFYPQSINWQTDKVEMEIYKVRDFNFKSIKVECLLGTFTSDEIIISERKDSILDMYKVFAKNIKGNKNSKLILPFVILTVENKQLISVEDVTGT